MIFIESNIISSYDELRQLLINKTKKGSYFLLNNDVYFEEITKDTVLSRDVLIEARKYEKGKNDLKYITFETNDECNTKILYELINILKEYTDIIITFYNPKDYECTLIFISNEYETILMQNIKNFVELEEY